MSKLLSFKIQKNNTCLVSCLADNPDYNNFKERVTAQFAKNVEVPGFRKGKAPLNLAMQKVDQSMLISTIYQESVEKFFAELEPQIKEKLKAEDRSILNNSIILDPDSLKDEGEGLKFSVTLNLLPKIDLKSVEEIEIIKPTSEDLPIRQTEEEFLENQKIAVFQNLNEFEDVTDKAKKDSQLIVDLVEVIEKTKSIPENKKETKDILITLGRNEFPPDFEKELLGLKIGDKKDFDLELKTELGLKKFSYKVFCKGVKYPKYKSLDELLEKSPDAKKAIPDSASFLESIKTLYYQETNQMIEAVFRRRVIEAILVQIPDFDLDEEKIDLETKRILHNLDQQAKDEEKELVDIFKLSGLPGSDDSNLKESKNVESHLKSYVFKEFKLAAILQSIYVVKVDNKIQETDLEALSKQIKSSPDNFNLSKTETSSEEKVKDIAFDRLLRKLSYDWIIKTIKIKEAKNLKTPEYKTTKDKKIVETNFSKVESSKTSKLNTKKA